MDLYIDREYHFVQDIRFELGSRFDWDTRFDSDIRFDLETRFDCYFQDIHSYFGDTQMLPETIAEEEDIV